MTEHPTAQPDAAQHENYRLPPHSIEAEQSVLGGLLLDNPSFDKIADVLTKEDFYRDDHRRIFWAICNLIEHNRPADVITVAEALDSTNELSYVGGLAYLGSLAQNTPSAANIRRYAEIVREKSVMRQLASVATEIADAAYNPGGREATDLLDEAESKVFSIAEQSSRGQKGFIAMPPILKEIVERIDHLYQQDNPSEVTGVATGFIDLDRMTSGLLKGVLIIVAGRPSMGKAQPRSRMARAVLMALVKYRRDLPTSSGRLPPPRTMGIRSASQASRRASPAEMGSPLSRTAAGPTPVVSVVRGMVIFAVGRSIP